MAHLRLSVDERKHMLQARLQSGAWDIAANYLRQAAAAELHQWGRQRDADNHLVDLISFDGVSPLALPSDAPNAMASHATVLLAIDEASGRLREVRELFGAVGTEQTTRTTWRVFGEEWLHDPTIIDGIFNHALAWNGVGAFVERTTLPQPALPLVDRRDVVALARSLTGFGVPMQLLATPPPDTNAVVLAKTSQPSANGSSFLDGSPLVTFYLGAHRQLELFSAFAIRPARRCSTARCSASMAES